jgi:acyl carrier protein
MSNIKNRIKEFLARSIRVPADELADSTPVYASPIFPSLTVLELLDFIEQTFGIDLDPADLSERNFATIALIADIVEQKLDA